MEFNGALRFNGGVGASDHTIVVEVHIEAGFSGKEAIGASRVNRVALQVPVGINVPFGQASVLMYPDDFDETEPFTTESELLLRGLERRHGVLQEGAPVLETLGEFVEQDQKTENMTVHSVHEK